MQTDSQKRVAERESSMQLLDGKCTRPGLREKAIQSQAGKATSTMNARRATFTPISGQLAECVASRAFYFRYHKQATGRLAMSHAGNPKIISLSTNTSDNLIIH